MSEENQVDQEVDLTNKFVMNRKFMVKGFGHEIQFEPNVPTHVPPILHTEAMRCGAVAMDQENATQVQREQGRIPEVQGEERAETITRAMDKLVQENLRMSFGADGLPTTKAIFRLTGIDLEKNERNAVWRARAQKLTAKADPTSNTITEEETAEIATKVAEAEDKDVNAAAEAELAEEIEAVAEKEAAVEIEQTLAKEPAPAPKKKAVRRKK